MPLVRNPILPGFNADPSILRVGNDYYIATSTFEWFPGVQIHHSVDLVNWTLVCRPLQHRSQLDMRGDPDSCGVWAPCLSHDGSRFWLVYTDVKRKDGSFKDTHNYIIHAPAITGPWSSTPIHANSSGFDPSLFHDPDDGRHWLVNLLWDHRRLQRDTSFSGIALQELQVDADAGRLVGPRRLIFRGTDLRLTEAPHLYKRNGVYYLLTAEGGTGYDHAVTMARSVRRPDTGTGTGTCSIWGPYETHPQKYILTSKDHPLAALQRAGHADIVEYGQGAPQTFLVHLTGRPTTQERRCVLGRETAIQAARWADDGWLYVDGGPVPSLHVDLPGHRDDDPATSPYWAERRYRFGDAGDVGDAAWTATTAGTGLHPDFQWLRTPEPGRILSVDRDRRQLVLFGRESVGSWFEQALVARRQEHFSFDAETVVDVSPRDERQFAGLTVYYSRYNFFYLAVTAREVYGGEDDGMEKDPPVQRELLTLSSEASHPLGQLQMPMPPTVALPATGKVRLAVTVRGRALQFWYALEEEKNDPEAGSTFGELKKTGPVYDASIVSDECGGHAEHGSFTGSFVGMAASDLNGTAMPARFDYFVYRPAHEVTDRYEV